MLISNRNRNFVCNIKIDRLFILFGILRSVKTKEKKRKKSGKFQFDPKKFKIVHHKMVKIGLQIRATLENIDELKTNHPDYPFFIKIKCTNCGEQSDKWHDLTESERINEDSRNPNGFNFYMKCKLCSRENSIDIVERSNASYTADDAGKFKTIVAFDCRGVEPVEFSPRTGWIVKAAENGQQFDDVDLSDDDWVEYDTKNNVSIGIYEFESNFIKLKK